MTIENLARDIKQALGSGGDAYASPCRIWISESHGPYQRYTMQEAIKYLGKLKEKQRCQYLKRLRERKEKR